MNSTEQVNKTKAAPNHDEIALLAYTLWQEQGSQPNRDVEYWLIAENRLKNNSGEHQSQLKAPQTTGQPSTETARNPFRRAANGRRELARP